MLLPLFCFFPSSSEVKQYNSALKLGLWVTNYQYIYHELIKVFLRHYDYSNFNDIKDTVSLFKVFFFNDNGYKPPMGIPSGFKMIRRFDLFIEQQKKKKKKFFFFFSFCSVPPTLPFLSSSLSSFLLSFIPPLLSALILPHPYLSLLYHPLSLIFPILFPFFF